MNLWKLFLLIEMQKEAKQLLFYFLLCFRKLVVCFIKYATSMRFQWKKVLMLSWNLNLSSGSSVTISWNVWLLQRSWIPSSAAFHSALQAEWKAGMLEKRQVEKSQDSRSGGLELHSTSINIVMGKTSPQKHSCEIRANELKLVAALN